MYELNGQMAYGSTMFRPVEPEYNTGIANSLRVAM